VGKCSLSNIFSTTAAHNFNYGKLIFSNKNVSTIELIETFL